MVDFEQVFIFRISHYEISKIFLRVSIKYLQEGEKKKKERFLCRNIGQVKILIKRYLTLSEFNFVEVKLPSAIILIVMI